MELTGSARKKYAQIKLDFNKQMAQYDGRQYHMSETASTMSEREAARFHRDINLSVEDGVGNHPIIEPAMDYPQNNNRTKLLGDGIGGHATSTPPSNSHIENQLVEDLTSTVNNEPSEADPIGSLEQKNEGQNLVTPDGRDRRPEISFDLRYPQPKLIEDDTAVDGSRCVDAVATKSSMLSNGYITCQ